MINSMLEPYIDEIACRLREVCALHDGVLPDLYRIAWHAYLSTGVVDHVDFEKVSSFFPNFDTDPNCNDPVLAIAVGKNYQDPDPSIPPGECIYETVFDGLSWKIHEDKKHLGGELPAGFVVAWAGKLLGLRDCKELEEVEYQKLREMLPKLEDNPIEELEAVTRKYLRT